MKLWDVPGFQFCKLLKWLYISNKAKHAPNSEMINTEDSEVDNQLGNKIDFTEYFVKDASKL